MNGKLNATYRYHASCRMQQGGISPELVEILLNIGRSAYHQGRERVYLDRKGLAMLQVEWDLTVAFCQRLRRHSLVPQGGEIVSIGQQTTHFKRDRH